MPGDSSGFGNELADVAAVGVESFFFAHKHIFQFKAIGLPKGLLENRAGNFEADEVVIAVGSVSFSCDFENVKAKFGFHMGQGVVLESNAVAKFLSEPGIQNRNGTVGAEAVTVVVRGVMRERADGESVFVDVLGVPQQRLDEIAAADVMRKIAEKGAAIRVIPHILNDRTAISVGLCPAQIFFCGLREFLQEERLDVRLPRCIDDGFMR